MARGESGRIVLEVDPVEKKELYAAVTRDGMTLKQWFVRQAAQYLQNRSQPSLFGDSFVEEAQGSYETPERSATVRRKSPKVKKK